MKIGLLRKYSKPMIKDTVAAMVAKEYSADAIFFTPDQIDFKNKIIKGLSLKFGQWEEVISCFPNVIYNDIPLRKDEDVYSRLEKEGIPFTTHRLGRNKIELQQKMTKDEYLSQFSIETAMYTGITDLFLFLKKHKSIFLKPNRGHKGLGIFILEIDGEHIIFQDCDGKKTIYTYEEMIGFLSTVPNLQHYHIQPNISSTTRSGEPYVIRSYVGRNGKGNWINFFHYAAIGLGGNNVVNVSRGSSMSYIAPFLKDTFGEQDQLFMKKLNNTSLKIAQSVQTFVKPKIDALGIDFGITDSGNIYIYEVNAFPGTRPFEALVERQAVPYALHLAKSIKQG